MNIIKLTKLLTFADHITIKFAKGGLTIIKFDAKSTNAKIECGRIATANAIANIRISFTVVKYLRKVFCPLIFLQYEKWYRPLE